MTPLETVQARLKKSKEQLHAVGDNLAQNQNRPRRRKEIERTEIEPRPWIIEQQKDQEPFKTQETIQSDDIKNNQQARNEHLTQSLTNTQQTLNTAYNNYLIQSQEPINGSQQTLNKHLTQRTTEHLTNTQQTLNKYPTTTKREPEINLTKTPEKFNFLKTTGLKRKILLFLFQSAQANKSRFTPPLSISVLASALHRKKNVIEVILSRMHLSDGMIVISDSKKGRDGWVIYKFPDVVYEEIWNFQEATNTKSKIGKHLANAEQSLNKYPTQHLMQHLTPATSSSSSLHKEDSKKTTTDSEKQNSLYGKWAKIDISPLAEYGFDRRDVFQMAQAAQAANIQPEDIQNSIDFFAFDLKHNHKKAKIQNLKAYFIGPIRKGILFAAPSNYLDTITSEQKKYTESLMAALERKQKADEDLRYAHAKEWISKLNEEEKQKIYPRTRYHDPIQAGNQLAALHDYFFQHVWPTLMESVYEKVKSRVGADENRRELIPTYRKE